MPERTVQRILRGLETGALRAQDLSARQLGGYLGYSTGHVYHHFGSLDGLLFAVAQAGFRKLAGRLAQCATTGGSSEDVAAEFVGFCLERPLLYGLMFERHYDWAALRARGAFAVVQPDLALWRALTQDLDARGAREPGEDARLFLAGLHGLVSLSLSGRANVGALERSDRVVAVSSARRLARLLFPRSDKEDRHAQARSSASGAKQKREAPARGTLARRSPRRPKARTLKG